MTEFRNLVKTKEANWKRLLNVMQEYSIKWIQKIFSNIDDKMKYKRFQIELSDVVHWDYDKQEKEFKKFTKWLVKNKMSINVFRELFKDTMLQTVQIMLYDYYKYDTSSIEIVDLESFVYKVNKKVAKYFYQNPKIVENIQDDTIKNIIDSVLNSCIPYESIVEIVENNPNNISVSDTSSYQSEVSSKSSKEVSRERSQKESTEASRKGSQRSQRSQRSRKGSVEKRSQREGSEDNEQKQEIPYIKYKSENNEEDEDGDFNEYYNTDNTDDTDKSEKTEVTRQEDIKVISMRKGYYNYKY